MERRKKILQLLIDSEQAVPVAEIARVLGISSKTVRNELDRLEKNVSDYQCAVIKTPGKGIRLEGDNRNLVRLQKSFEKNSEGQEDSPAERQYLIFFQLCGSSEAVLIKELCACYYISKTTINSDIKELNRLVVPYRISVVYEKQQGLKVAGDENDIRNAMVGVISRRFGGTIGTAVKLDGAQILYDDSIRVLENMLGMDLAVLIDLIREAELAFRCKFSSESMLELALYLGVMCRRAGMGYTVTISRDLGEVLYGSLQLGFCNQIADKLEHQYGIHLSMSEREYILLRILSAQKLKAASVPEDGMLIGERDISREIEEFICAVGDRLGIDFHNDKELYERLYNHIKPSVFRLLLGLDLGNSLLKQIEQEYRKIFRIIQEYIVILNDAFHIEFPENEIAYLTLHFVVALEKLTPKIRILLVCASGLGLSQLMVSRLQGMFRNIEIAGAISVYDIEDYRNANIDMIISTVNIEELEWVKTLVVNPIFSKMDIKNITQEICFRSSKGNIAYLFQEQNIYFKDGFQSKEEALHFLAQELEREDFVTAEFGATMLKRETMGSTYIGNRAAVVHGDMDQVKHSVLQILRLEQPVSWGDGNIADMIINVVATKQDSMSYARIFRALGNYLDEEEFWAGLRTCGTPGELAEILNKELAYDY